MNKFLSFESFFVTINNNILKLESNAMVKQSKTVIYHNHIKGKYL